MNEEAIQLRSDATIVMLKKSIELMEKTDKLDCDFVDLFRELSEFISKSYDRDAVGDVHDAIKRLMS